MEKIIITAVSENNVIGKNGIIPWHIPKDLKHFEELTRDYPVIMGRKTCESIGKPLYARINIVVTRDKKFLDKKFVICHSIEEAIERAEDFNEFASDLNVLCKTKHTPKVYFIGGEGIYRQTIHLADRLELTRVHKIVQGDTFFPEINYNEWKEVSRKDFPEFSFVSYVRK